jgi:hypothetical protein
MAEVLHGTHDVDHPLSAARLPAQRSRDSTSPDRPAARYPRAAARGRAKEHPVACRLDSHPERVTRRPVRLGLLEQGNSQLPAHLRCEDGPRPLVGALGTPRRGRGERGRAHLARDANGPLQGFWPLSTPFASKLGRGSGSSLRDRASERRGREQQRHHGDLACDCLNLRLLSMAGDHPAQRRLPLFSSPPHPCARS